MTDYEIVVQHLQNQRNDAQNVIVNLMLSNTRLTERIQELEEQLKEKQADEAIVAALRHTTKKEKKDGDVQGSTAQG